MATSIGKIKQGESFIINCSYFEADGVTPKSLAGITLKAQLKDTLNDWLMDTFIITVTNESLGEFTIEGHNTATWNLGTLTLDVMQTEAGRVSISDSATIVVEKAMTKA
jgi:hypothetical protein